MNKEKMLFQSKVDKDLLKRFRTIQKNEGITTRFLIEKFMLDHINSFQNRMRITYEEPQKI